MIYLASYPRSGNTWLRFLVANMWAGATTLKGVERTTTQKGCDFFKTHTDDPTCCFNPKADYAIYITRHPFDVCASMWEFYRLQGHKYKPHTFGKKVFCDIKGFWEYGRWGEHVENWLFSPLAKEAGARILCLQYEDLADSLITRRTVTELRRFLCELNPHVGPVERAIEFASQDNMRRMEEEAIAQRAEGAFYKEKRQPQYDHGWRFLPKCHPNRAEGILSRDDKRRIVDEYGDTMLKLGYGVDV